MSKTILGLDLGTNSIGWALVKEAENTNETSEIIKLGVRVNPLTVDEQTNFDKGKPITTNAERTLKRGARRNLHRYKLRRESLIELLTKTNIITPETPLTEVGKNTTHQTLMLRATAAHKKVKLEDLAKILLAINKKRGYKSSRKTKGEDEGVAVDGMSVAKILYEENITPGEYVYKSLNEGKKYIPDFYRSDLRNEFNKIWDKQTEFFPTQLTKDLLHAVEDKNKGQTYKILEEPWNLKGFKQTGRKEEQRLERYKWRHQALSEKLELEKLVIVLQDINGELNNSSGYLGAISDRSKNSILIK